MHRKLIAIIFNVTWCFISVRELVRKLTLTVYCEHSFNIMNTFRVYLVCMYVCTYVYYIMYVV